MSFLRTVLQVVGPKDFLTCCSLYFELILYIKCEVWVKVLSFFLCACPVAPTLFMEKAVLPLLTCSGIFTEIDGSYHVGPPRLLCYVPLIEMFVHQYCTVSITAAIWSVSKLGRVIPPTYFFIFKIVLANLLPFHIKFRITVTVSIKDLARIL